MTKRFHETRIELIRRIAREAQIDKALVVTAFADTFVTLAHAMSPTAFEDSNLRLPHPVDAAQHEKDRAHNRQIVDRWLKGAVHEFPAEFEEPWVLALPDETRERAIIALFARYDRLPARRPVAENALSSFSEVLQGVSDVVETAAPVFADGRIDAEDIPHAKPALLAINSLQSKLSTYEAQLIAILPDEAPNVIQMRSAG